MLDCLELTLPREMYPHPNRWILAVCCDRIGWIFDKVAFFTQNNSTQATSWLEGTGNLLKALRIVSASSASPPPLTRNALKEAQTTMQHCFASETFPSYVSFWVYYSQRNAQGEPWHPPIVELFRLCRVVYPWALREAKNTSNTALGSLHHSGRPSTSSSLGSFGCHDGMTISPSDGVDHGSVAPTTDATLAISEATIGMPYHEMPRSKTPQPIHQSLSLTPAAVSSRSRHGQRMPKATGVSVAPRQRPEKLPERTRQKAIPAATSRSGPSTGHTKPSSSFSCFGFSRRSPSPLPPSVVHTQASSMSRGKRERRTDSGWSSVRTR